MIAATLLSTFSALRGVTLPMQLVSQCFARSANQDPYYPLLGPPRSQFYELRATRSCRLQTHADSVEEVNVGGKTQEMARLRRCTALYLVRHIFANP